MSDTQYELFQQYGTNAERLAFTPSPPAGIQPIYVWYETDTGASYVYDSSWHPLGGAGGGLPASVQGDTFYASAVNTVTTLAKDANATRYLSNTGASNNPAWAQVNLANGVTGILPVANGGTGSASGAGILLATVSLSDAQIKALPSTPVTIIAAGGANTLIVPLQITMCFKAGATAYTNIDTAGAFCLFQVPAAGGFGSGLLGNDSSLATPLTDFSDFFNSTGNKLLTILWPFADDRGSANQWGLMAYQSSLSGSVNQPLQIAMSNTLGNLTGGNAGNVIQVDVIYRVMTTP